MKRAVFSIWTFFKKTPVGRLVRNLAPQWLVNILEHLPIAVLANILYGFPSYRLKVIGVTGTDGKTTTVNMIYQILRKAGRKVSMISTINASINGKEYDTGFHVTSPHSFTIQEFITKALKGGSEYIVLEVTSHALDQFRFWGVKFDIGVITNITHEHLDYHKTFENYFNAKAKLIRNTKVAILNREEKHFNRLSHLTYGMCKVVSFGLTRQADFNPYKFPLKLKILGEYNLLNSLATSAVAVNLGIKPGIIRKALAGFTTLPGRMEEVRNKTGIKIIVDFAHTPNGLRQALETLKTITKGKLISVFGAASERDLAKRPMMGKISSEIADVTILTDEDPRFEDSNKIIDEIARGAISDSNIYKEPDRFKAIKKALRIAKRGDTIGIFGKGHERSMNYNGVEKPWSDSAAVLKALNG